ncbi:MAG: FecR domain-containing protein [Candidatus Omnitrophota bacterium]|jgi:hypothetical protein
MSALRIERPEVKRKNNVTWILLSVFVLLVVAGALFWFLCTGTQCLTAPQSPVDPFEITNFTGKPEFYLAEKKSWIPAMRSGVLTSEDKIKTGPGEEVDLRIPDVVFLRLKENSILSGARPGRFEKAGDKPVYRLHLIQGALIGATEPGFRDKAELRITTAEAVTNVREGIFEIREKSPVNWIGVLRGMTQVGSRSKFPKGAVEVLPLQCLEIKGSEAATKPARITPEEWDHMKEGYELIQRGAAHEAEQIDLARKAGTLFDKVFDHGTFYTPKVGYATREFAGTDDGAVVLTIEYDVFPRDSFVGMYLKTRELDLREYSALEFEARLSPDTDGLKEMQIEMKSKGSVARRLSAKTFDKQWKALSFPLSANKSTPLQEITFLFAHDRVGETMKGMVELRNLNLVKNPNLPPPEPKAAAAPAPAPARAVAVAPVPAPAQASAETYKPDSIIADVKKAVVVEPSAVSAGKSAPAAVKAPLPPKGEDYIPDDF